MIKNHHKVRLLYAKRRQLKTASRHNAENEGSMALSGDKQSHSQTPCSCIQVCTRPLSASDKCKPNLLRRHKISSAV